MSKIAYIEVCQKVSSASCMRKPELITNFLIEAALGKLKNNEEAICKEIEEMVKEILKKCLYITLNKNMLACFSSTKLIDHIDSIIVSTNDNEDFKIQIQHHETLKFFVYRLSQEEAATETVQHDSEELSVASHVILPTVEYQGLWESLYYDTDIKGNLLNFVETTMMYSDRKVDHNIISWNRVVLLHGPPGTGKTSLCKAIAQKIAIRLGERYAYAELVEINSHSLFSKWFSESGKLVMKLFDEVRLLLDNPDALVCVLIDEVESLAHARKSCANGTEPSDAIRVVNALLTQLDQIKRYPNVLILTTSNVTEAIDLAFVDRADIKQYIGHPQEKAIYKIYTSCLEELMRTKLVTKEPIFQIEILEERNFIEEPATIMSLFVLSLSKLSVGLSGRSLRKIPFLAHAMDVQARECSLETFLKAMKRTIEKHKKDDLLYT